MAESSSPPADQLSTVTINDAVEVAQFSQRSLIRTILSRSDGGAGLAGQTVRIGGWVKTGRKQDKGAFAFLEVNDGSCPANLQVMVDSGIYPLGQLVHTGTAVHIEGQLQLPPEGKTQKIELKAQKVLDVGTVDPAKYPLPKTKLTLEFLRDFVHLRPKTNTVCSLSIYSYELCCR